MNRQAKRRHQLGTSLGGKMRAVLLSPRRRKQIARKAALKRWGPSPSRAHVQELERRVAELEAQIEGMVSRLVLPLEPKTSSNRVVRLPVVQVDPPANDVPVVFTRPRVRGDCAGVPRPCPYASCRHNNALLNITEVGPRWHPAVLLPDGEVDLTQMPARLSCALDLADEGGLSLEGVGEALNVTRERIRQIEQMACRQMMRNTKES